MTTEIQTSGTSDAAPASPEPNLTQKQQPEAKTMEQGQQPKTGQVPQESEKWFVLDTTAVAGGPPRVHEQIIDGVVTSFKFEPGVALAIDPPIAIKFLQHESFWLMDARGKRVPYARRPKQPDDLGAGERLKLAENETIARYDELSNRALYERVVAIPGGEKFAQGARAPERSEMISFIIDTTVARKKASLSSDRDPDSYRPKAAAEADFEDEEEAA